MTRTIRLDVTLPVKITKRKKWFLASCLILDIHSQGETAEKAKRSLIEALSLFLVSCFERGILDEVLKNCGFKPLYRRIPQKPSLMKNETFVSVPIPFFISPQPSSECHV